MLSQQDDELLKAALITHEGLKFTVYDDKTGRPIVAGSVVQGHPTIGIGCDLTIPLSSDAVDFLYHERKNAMLAGLTHTYPWFDRLSSSRQRAIMDLAFNVGVTGLQKSPKMLAAIILGDFATAATELLTGPWNTEVGDSRANDVATALRGEPV